VGPVGWGVRTTSWLSAHASNETIRREPSAARAGKGRADGHEALTKQKDWQHHGPNPGGPDAAPAAATTSSMSASDVKMLSQTCGPHPAGHAVGIGGTATVLQLLLYYFCKGPMPPRAAIPPQGDGLSPVMWLCRLLGCSISACWHSR
jgi:hypothetical protein